MKDGNYIMTFGKYRGQTLDYIGEYDVSYLMWLDQDKVLKDIDPKFIESYLQDYYALEYNYVDEEESSREGGTYYY